MKQLQWIPAQGIEPAALLRLRRNFPRPAEPMGEAWFMSEKRHMFDELMGDLDRLPVDALMKPLEEIASGTGSFGRMDEWCDWYHYLLAATLPRSHESYVKYLLELLVTGFIALYPEGIASEPYAGFGEDVVHTLGRCMMDAQCWHSPVEVNLAHALHGPEADLARSWYWHDPSGDFSASMFFCLKYLPTGRIEPWLESAFAIESPHWRAQMMAWWVGAYSILTEEPDWPAGWHERQSPDISWSWSHCLSADLASPDGRPVLGLPFLPAPAREAALRFVRSWASSDGLWSSWETVARVPCLESGLLDIPVTFADLYRAPGR